MLRGVGIRVCLCLSVTSRGILSKRMNESSWFWALELPSTRPTLCSKKIRVSPKIRVLPSGTLSQTPDLENFASAYRSSKRVMCYQLSSTTWRHSERDKLDIIGQLSWQYLRAPTLDHCSWSHAIVKLSLQHDSVARVHQRQLIVASFGQRLQRSNSLVWFHACCSLKFALASRA